MGARQRQQPQQGQGLLSGIRSSSWQRPLVAHRTRPTKPARSPLPLTHLVVFPSGWVVLLHWGLRRGQRQAVPHARLALADVHAGRGLERRGRGLLSGGKRRRRQQRQRKRQRQQRQGLRVAGGQWRLCSAALPAAIRSTGSFKGRQAVLHPAAPQLQRQREGRTCERIIAIAPILQSGACSSAASSRVAGAAVLGSWGGPSGAFTRAPLPKAAQCADERNEHRAAARVCRWLDSWPGERRQRSGSVSAGAAARPCRRGWPAHPKSGPVG